MHPLLGHDGVIMKQSMFEGIIKEAMARGKIVLDENLESLAEELRKRNIIVILPVKGMSDEDIKEKMISGRLFVTNNSKDFVDDASSYEYGIISTEKIKFKDSKSMSKMISDAIIKHKLWSQSNSFILVLHENGKHVMKSLHDNKR
jgi:hypothetical protein